MSWTIIMSLKKEKKGATMWATELIIFEERQIYTHPTRFRA